MAPEHDPLDPVGEVTEEEDVFVLLVDVTLVLLEDALVLLDVALVLDVVAPVPFRH